MMYLCDDVVTLLYDYNDAKNLPLSFSNNVKSELPLTLSYKMPFLRLKMTLTTFTCFVVIRLFVTWRIHIAKPIIC